VLDLFGKAKDSAKRAFAGQTVKRKNEFQIGVNDPADLGSVLSRAGIVLASARRAENAGPLKSKGGYIASDADELEAAIKRVSDVDKAPQASQSVSIAGTNARNTAANELYAKLL